MEISIQYEFHHILEQTIVLLIERLFACMYVYSFI